jgi:4-hydroxy-3-methylbut-2-en-1-yl diphosphate synthase IspG/GcpE
MKSVKRVVKIGVVELGGNATVNQIKRLERAGCELVRLAVVDRKDGAVLNRIKKSVGIPIIADIHFDYRLAMQAIDAGVDKIRINPGNIGESWKVTEVIKKAKDTNRLMMPLLFFGKTTSGILSYQQKERMSKLLLRSMKSLIKDLSIRFTLVLLRRGYHFEAG